ncbi:MAG: hypothetical protein JSR86_05750 [Proteobacteria bacterium]|nr:hypothetical protein [Pseudomonadota bacterium]
MNHKTLACLLGAALLAGCSKPAAPGASAAAPAGPAASAAAAAPIAPPAASGPEVAGTFTVDGKAATLTQVTAHAGEPFDDKPVTLLVFTAKDQGGDAKADFDAMFGKFGDALVIKVQPDGSVVGADVVHSGLKTPGSVSISGVMTMQGYSAAGGQISGHLASGGPTDVFGQKLQVDLTFHTKAP